MIFPVRVPANTEAYSIGVFRLVKANPAYRLDCPVCGKRLGGEPTTMVYVGVEPERRRTAGNMRGAAVLVHVSCTDTPKETGE